MFKNRKKKVRSAGSGHFGGVLFVMPRYMCLQGQVTGSGMGLSALWNTTVLNSLVWREVILHFAGIEWSSGGLLWKSTKKQIRITSSGFSSIVRRGWARHPINSLAKKLVFSKFTIIFYINHYLVLSLVGGRVSIHHVCVCFGAGKLTIFSTGDLYTKSHVHCT